MTARDIIQAVGPAAFSRLLGLPLDTVQHWSSGRREPSAAAVQLIERLHAKAYEHSGVVFVVLLAEAGRWLAYCGSGGPCARLEIADESSSVKARCAAMRWIDGWLSQQEGGE